MMRLFALLIFIGVTTMACDTHSPVSKAGLDTIAEKRIYNAAFSESKGAALVKKSDCLSCHKTNMQMIGPAFSVIADKYTQADIEMLIDKVIKGSKGTWDMGEMNSHPKLKREDVREMVRYVLACNQGYRDF